MTALFSLAVADFLISFFSSTKPHLLPRKTHIPFPLAPPPSISFPTPRSSTTRNGPIQQLWATYYNVEVVVEDDEPEDVVLGRFRRKVLKAAIIQECRRRKRFENSQDKKKRRAREAIKRRSGRRPRPKIMKEKETSSSKKEWYDFEGDNWELLPDELPYGL